MILSFKIVQNGSSKDIEIILNSIMELLSRILITKLVFSYFTLADENKIVADSEAIRR